MVNHIHLFCPLTMMYAPKLERDEGFPMTSDNICLILHPLFEGLYDDLRFIIHDGLSVVEHATCQEKNTN